MKSTERYVGKGGGTLRTFRNNDYLVNSNTLKKKKTVLIMSHKKSNLPGLVSTFHDLKLGEKTPHYKMSILIHNVYINGKQYFPKIY